MKLNIRAFFFSLGFLVASSAAHAATIDVQADKPGHKVAPTLWGIFFEDINLSADGGIYPELVRNRSFEDAEKPENWKLTNEGDGRSEYAVDDSRPLNPLNRRRCASRWTVRSSGERRLLGHEPGQGRRVHVQVGGADGWFQRPDHGAGLSSSGKELAKGEISGLTGNWKYYTLDLTAIDADPKARLQISGAGKGTLFLDMVSLMPKKTWKNMACVPISPNH